MKIGANGTPTFIVGKSIGERRGWRTCGGRHAVPGVRRKAERARREIGVSAPPGPPERSAAPRDSLPAASGRVSRIARPPRAPRQRRPFSVGTPSGRPPPLRRCRFRGIEQLVRPRQNILGRVRSASAAAVQISRAAAGEPGAARKRHQRAPTIEHDQRAVAMRVEGHLVGERRALCPALQAAAAPSWRRSTRPRANPRKRRHSRRIAAR